MSLDTYKCIHKPFSYEYFQKYCGHSPRQLYDFRVSFTPDQVASGHIGYNFGEWRETGEEWPGLSAFFKDEAGNVFHTYSTFGRGVEVMMGTYAMLDLMPKGLVTIATSKRPGGGGMCTAQTSSGWRVWVAV